MTGTEKRAAAAAAPAMTAASMSGLPKGWEMDYDGTRWFYRYRPNDHVQYHFPAEGDEFPSFVDAAAPAPDLAPEERLESQQQLRRRTSQGGGAGDNSSSNSSSSAAHPRRDGGGRLGMSATAGRPVSAVWEDEDGDARDIGGARAVFQPESFMFLGPGAYTDVSPLVEDEDEAAKRAVAGAQGSGGMVVSPDRSEKATPVTTKSDMAQPFTQSSIPARAPGPLNKEEEEEEEPQPAVHMIDGREMPQELPAIEAALGWRHYLDPVGVVPEMSTEQTSAARTEMHPDPVELGDGSVLTPVERPREEVAKELDGTGEVRKGLEVRDKASKTLGRTQEALNPDETPVVKKEEAPEAVDARKIEIIKEARANERPADGSSYRAFSPSRISEDTRRQSTGESSDATTRAQAAQRRQPSLAMHPARHSISNIDPSSIPSVLSLAQPPADPSRRDAPAPEAPAPQAGPVASQVEPPQQLLRSAAADLSKVPSLLRPARRKPTPQAAQQVDATQPSPERVQPPGSLAFGSSYRSPPQSQHQPSPQPRADDARISSQWQVQEAPRTNPHEATAGQEQFQSMQPGPVYVHFREPEPGVRQANYDPAAATSPPVQQPQQPSYYPEPRPHHSGPTQKLPLTANQALQQWKQNSMPSPGGTVPPPNAQTAVSPGSQGIPQGRPTASAFRRESSNEQNFTHSPLSQTPSSQGAPGSHGNSVSPFLRDVGPRSASFSGAYPSITQRASFSPPVGQGAVPGNSGPSPPVQTSYFPTQGQPDARSDSSTRLARNHVMDGLNSLRRMSMPPQHAPALMRYDSSPATVQGHMHPQGAVASHPHYSGPQRAQSVHWQEPPAQSPPSEEPRSYWDAHIPQMPPQDVSKPGTTNLHRIQEREEAEKAADAVSMMSSDSSQAGRASVALSSQHSAEFGARAVQQSADLNHFATSPQMNAGPPHGGGPLPPWQPSTRAPAQSPMGWPSQAMPAQPSQPPMPAQRASVGSMPSYGPGPVPGQMPPRQIHLQGQMPPPGHIPQLGQMPPYQSPYQQQPWNPQMQNQIQAVQRADSAPLSPTSPRDKEKKWTKWFKGPKPGPPQPPQQGSSGPATTHRLQKPPSESAPANWGGGSYAQPAVWQPGLPIASQAAPVQQSQGMPFREPATPETTSQMPMPPHGYASQPVGPGQNMIQPLLFSSSNAPSQKSMGYHGPGVNDRAAGPSQRSIPPSQGHNKWAGNPAADYSGGGWGQDPW